MKLVIAGVLLAAFVSLAHAQTSSAPKNKPPAKTASPDSSPAPQKAEPSYEDTLHYIQERLGGGLEENGRCHFTYHVDFYAIQAFNAAALSPHVSWDSQGGSINCAGGAQCAIDKNGNASATEWRFGIKPDADRSKMEKALLHLLDLCGVRPPKPDLF